ncbi:MAG: hypothetical protein Fur006_47520 [Coleofasciculaceae cyanobacterium]
MTMKVKDKKVGTMTNELWQKLDDRQAETISGGVRGEGKVGRIDINDLKYETCDPNTCC